MRGYARSLQAFFLVPLLMYPSSIFSHGGGLDAYGCHHVRRTGDYHCHRGGYVQSERQGAVTPLASPMISQQTSQALVEQERNRAYLESASELIKYSEDLKMKIAEERDKNQRLKAENSRLKSEMESMQRFINVLQNR